MLPVEDAPGYRVLDQAGQGGFAIVYRAYQERLDRIVALKVLSVDRVDQRTMRRFQRELQLTGRLTGHPNVVTVFDTGVTRSGRPYIAMDFFENGSLRDKVRREGPLQVADVMRAGVKLAGALAAVHEAGVLHGDIKPQNVLISRYGEPAIADFGVARVVDSSEISGSAQAFTPLHAAPEVLTGQPHSSTTDIYSLGSTLYHVLAGQPAFFNPTDPSIAPLMYRVLSIEPSPINRADVPPALFEAILRAMAKQPEARYGSAREFALRLQEAQAALGLPVTELVGEDPGSHTGGPTPFPPPPPGSHTGGPTSFPPQPPESHTAGSTVYAVPPPGSAPFAHQGAGAPPAGAPPAGSQPFGFPPSGTGGGPPVPATVPPGYGGSLTPPGRGRSSRTKITAVVVGAVAIVALAGAGFAVYLSRHQAPTPDPRADRPASTQPQQSTGPQQSTYPTAGTGTVDQEALALLAPREVRVTADQGTLVKLQWALPEEAVRYPVVLQRSPVKQGEQPITVLQKGATSAQVAGLDPDTGYCFLVGVPLRISESSTVAWSKPACIRGAVTTNG